MANKFVFDESIQPVFFRVDGGYDGYGVNFYTTKFHGFCETKQGWWVTIERGNYLQSMLSGVPEEKWLKTIKERFPDETFWISKYKSTRRAWCTLELALNSFRQRKISQNHILDVQQTSAQAQYAAACLLSEEEIDKLRLTGRVKHTDRAEWQPFLEQKKRESEEIFGFGRPF